MRAVCSTRARGETACSRRDDTIGGKRRRFKTQWTCDDAEEARVTSARKRGQQEAFQTRRRQPDDTEIRVEARRRLMPSPNSQCVWCVRV
jgi:hypothetical protein